MVTESKTLYHSLDDQAYKAVLADGRLYGQVILHPREGYSRGANLTTDKSASQSFIREFRGMGQWKAADEPPRLLTLTFEVPGDLAEFAGLTHGLGCPEYATALTVDARDLPDEYFARRHAGAFPYLKEQAVQDQDRGLRRFYQVPLEYLTGVEPVEYEYRGVRYP